jgi:hypothetical protein
MHGRREKNAAHFWSGGQAIKCVCFEGRTSSTQRYFGDRQALGGSCGKGRNRPEADSRPPRAAPVEMSRAQIFAYGDQSQGARSSETRGGAACPRIQVTGRRPRPSASAKSSSGRR